MRIIDKYILRHFIQNFIFGLFCFVLIFIMVDLFENMDKFIDRQLSFVLVLQYYLYFIPDILKLISPVGMLLASLFTISRFINYSELTAMKSAGISIYRYLLPILIFGAIITLFAVYFNGWIVPTANQKKFAFERKYLGRKIINENTQNIYFQDKTNRIIIINNYNIKTQTCDNTLILIFNPDSLTKLDYKISINHLKYDFTNKDWHFDTLSIRKFINYESEELSIKKNMLFSELKDFDKLRITPDQIEKKQLRPEEMVLTDFGEYIDNLDRSGQDASKEKVEYYSIISFPFANIITIIFGVSISTNRRKGGAALHFGISLIVSFIYLGFVKISQVFGNNGDLNPIFTAWLANIVFLSFSLYNFYRINRT